MTFLRQKYKQKPKQRGPFSRVQSSLFHNLENIFGIDHQTCALALPCWGPGDQRDYSKNGFDGINTGATFAKNKLNFNGSASIDYGNIPAWVLDPLTIITAAKLNETPALKCLFYFHDQSYNVLTAFWYPNTNGLTVGRHTFNSGLSYDPDITIFHNYAFRYVGNAAVRASVFVDGNDATSSGVSLSSNGDSFKIGKFGTSSAYNPEMDMSYFLYFTTALPSSQIAQLSDNPYQLWQRVSPISYFFPVGGSGGTVFDVACLDGFNLNDAISRNAIFSAVANETLSLSSSPGNIGNFLSSTLSQISMTGSTSTRMIILGNAVDSIGVGDTASVLSAITGLVSDSVNLSDSTNSEGIFQGSASDSVSFADAVVNSLITQGIINEIVNLSDATSLGAFIDAVVDDQITLSDGTVNVAALIAEIQENINLSDSVTAILQALASASDTINLSDLSAWGAVQQALAASGLSLTDSAAANLQLFAQSADSITFDDASHMTAVFNVTITDAVSFAETISKIALFQASVADSARFSATAMEVSTLPNGKVTVSFDIKIPGVGFGLI